MERLTISEDLAHIVECIKLMNRKVKINEAEYQKWRIEKKTKQPRPRVDNPYLRGSDFKEYWICPRRLFFGVHNPLPHKGRANKSIYEAIIRHQIIEEYLEQYGWQSEYHVKTRTRLIPFYLPFYGHVDSLSPNSLILDIKHNQPSTGDLLQLGSYSLHLGWKPIVVLYRTGFTYNKTLATLIKKYMPRVLTCILLNHLPPLHPNFPNCYYNCVYYKRCGRTRKPPKKQGVPQEWIDWLKKTEELME